MYICIYIHIHIYIYIYISGARTDSRKQAGITRSVEPIIVFQMVKIIAAEPEPVTTQTNKLISNNI